MPDEVPKPMSEILTRLESVLKTKTPHVLETLQAGLSAEQIATLERQVGFEIPEDIKVLAKCYEEGAFRIKAGPGPPLLDEDPTLLSKIWREFGASNQPEQQ